MIGIVVVSHSTERADAAVALALQMVPTPPPASLRLPPRSV